MNQDTVNEINEALEKVIDAVAEKALSLLKRCIDETIYSPKRPKQYKRTYEFKDKAFEIKKDHMKKLMRQIIFNGSNLTYNPSEYQHGGKNVDRTSLMAYILDSDTGANMDNSDWGGALNVYTNQSYWRVFIQRLDKELDTYIQDELNKYF